MASVNTRNFYVYEHWRPDTGLPFYVGKGKGNRAYSLVRRNRFHKKVQKALQKLDLEVEIRKVFTYLEEDTAFTLEASQVAYWRQRGIKLLNLSDGGIGGTSGFKPTAKQKKNIQAGVVAAWSKPERRIKQSIALIAAGKRPEVKANRRAGAKAQWANPKTRATIIAAQKAAQSRPEIRALQSEVQTIAQNRPEVAARMSAIITEVWKRPEFYAKMVAAQKARHAREKAQKVIT